MPAQMGQRGHTNHVHSCRGNPDNLPNSTCIHLKPLPYGNRILQDALGGLSFSRDSSHYEVYNNVPEFPDLLHRTFTSLTAENQACGWWLPFHSSHTCPPYHLPEALAGPDLFNVSSCPLPFCPICFPGGALLCITLPVTADNDALCAFAQETDGKERRGRHLRHAVVVSEGAGCDGLVEKRAV